MMHQPLIENSLNEHDRLARSFTIKAMKAGLTGKVDVCFLYSRLAKFHGEFRSKYETAKIYFEETCRSEIFEVKLGSRNPSPRVYYEDEWWPDIFEVTLG